MQQENNLTVTPITYEETVKILDSDISTLKNALVRGVLSKLPRKGMHVKLIKEQVILFVGKRFSLSELNTYEMSIWEQYKQIAHNYETDTYQLIPVPTLDNSSFMQVNKKLDAIIELQSRFIELVAASSTSRRYL